MLESYLIAVATKSTALLVAGLLCWRLLRGRDAAVRHLVCLAALASAAAVPLLALWSPQWSFLISTPVRAGVAGTASGAVSRTADWPMALALIWALGVLVFAIRAAGGWILLLRCRRRSAHFQDADGVEVRIGDLTTPLTCGVLRPLILLPESARDWDDLRLRTVLVHEWAHVRRHDCASRYLAQAARALLWWNPLAWMVSDRLNREQELACDDAVLASGVTADAYATVLLDVAREGSAALVLGCAMEGVALRERFRHLFEWQRNTAPSSRRSAMAIPVLLLLLSAISFAEKIYQVGPGIVPPKVLQKHDPVYPKKEKAAKIQGKVVLNVVVGTDQHAHDIQVTQSATPALDASAVTAVRSWTFQPGAKDGKPVPVRARIEINFRLH
jgi:bla regulator protein blaR1